MLALAAEAAEKTTELETARAEAAAAADVRQRRVEELEGQVERTQEVLSVFRVGPVGLVMVWVAKPGWVDGSIFTSHLVSVCVQCFLAYLQDWVLARDVSQ